MINNTTNVITMDKAYIYGFFFGKGIITYDGSKYKWELNTKDLELNKLLSIYKKTIADDIEDTI